MRVDFANEHEDRLCRALVALREAATPWVTPNEVGMSYNVQRQLVGRGLIIQRQQGKQEFQLTESGQGMAALVASLLKV